MISPNPSFEAKVSAELPQQLFRIESENGPLVAGLSIEAQRIGLKLRTGQRVRVRRSRRDPGRGIIEAAIAEDWPSR